MPPNHPTILKNCWVIFTLKTDSWFLQKNIMSTVAFAAEMDAGTVRINQNTAVEQRPSTHKTTLGTTGKIQATITRGLGYTVKNLVQTSHKLWRWRFDFT